jgi:hypothetical protein
VAVGYFVRGDGDSWALIRVTGRTREDMVADCLSREAAEERYFEKLEELRAGVAAEGELPLVGDIAPGRRRPKQLTFKF